MDAQHSMHAGRAKMAAEELRVMEEEPIQHIHLHSLRHQLAEAEARAEAAEKQLRSVTEKLTQAQTLAGRNREEALRYYGQLAEAEKANAHWHQRVTALLNNKDASDTRLEEARVRIGIGPCPLCGREWVNDEEGIVHSSSCPLREDD